LARKRKGRVPGKKGGPEGRRLFKATGREWGAVCSEGQGVKTDEPSLENGKAGGRKEGRSEGQIHLREQGYREQNLIGRGRGGKNCDFSPVEGN